MNIPAISRPDTSSSCINLYFDNRSFCPNQFAIVFRVRGPTFERLNKIKSPCPYFIRWPLQKSRVLSSLEHSSSVHPSFLPLETLISPHKISVNSRTQFCLLRTLTSGLEKSQSFGSARLSRGWNDRKDVQNPIFLLKVLFPVAPRTTLELRSSHAKMSNWFTGKPVRVRAVVVLGRSRRHE